MRNPLFNLFRANAKRGLLKAEASSNTIWIYDFIVASETEAYWFGGVSAEGFAQALAQMTGPVTVRLNSPGGDVFGGRAIAAAIRGYDGAVTVQIDGLAASAASTIAVAGDTVTASPDAMIMIHDAWTFTLGNKGDHLAQADLLGKIDVGIAASYAAKSGDEATDWAALMTAETWFSAQEALDLGLIDAINAANPAKTENRLSWDLSAFANAPLPSEPEQVHQRDKPEMFLPIENNTISAPYRQYSKDDLVRLDEIAARQRKVAVALL